MAESLPEIVPYPGNPDYGVTRCGRVFRIRKARFGRPVPYELKSCVNGVGYLVVWPRGTADRGVLCVHRMVAETFLPVPNGDSTGLDAAHRDGTRANNNVENLYWATRVQNMADCIRHGRTLRGEKQPTHKLTTQDVLAIRASRASKAALARTFGVSTGCIADVRSRRNWKHVP